MEPDPAAPDPAEEGGFYSDEPQDVCAGFQDLADRTGALAGAGLSPDEWHALAMLTCAANAILTNAEGAWTPVPQGEGEGEVHAFAAMAAVAPPPPKRPRKPKSATALPPYKR